MSSITGYHRSEANRIVGYGEGSFRKYYSSSRLSVLISHIQFLRDRQSHVELQSHSSYHCKELVSDIRHRQSHLSS